MRTTQRENEVNLHQLPSLVRQSQFLTTHLKKSAEWIDALRDPDIGTILDEKIVTLSKDQKEHQAENQIVHFHKTDIADILKKKGILKKNDKFPFGIEYHKASKNIYVVLKENKKQLIFGKGFFSYVKILQNIHTKNFIARKTDIFSDEQYQRKLKSTKKEIRILSKRFGSQNIAYAFRYRKTKGFFAKLLRKQNLLPNKIDILMPWIPGRELYDFINELRYGDQHKELLCYKIMLTIALQLQHLHQMKIIHGDIKPENIKLHIVNNEVQSLHIFDFNLAKKATKTIIEDGDEIIMAYAKQISGTRAYFDSRVLQSFVYSSKSDTFALILILFEMLMRIDPFLTYSNEYTEFERLKKIRSRFLNLKMQSAADATFLSEFMLGKENPYPSLQTFIRGIEEKILELSEELDGKGIKTPKNALLTYSEGLGLFGLPKENKQSKSIDKELVTHECELTY